jgi:Putative transposase
MAAEQAMLLPVPYFRLVFTLPHALNALVRANRRRLYGLLFRVVAATLHTFAHDPRHLGATPAITMVLHTWGQTLTAHTHVHCVVSGGGLSLDGSSWIALPAGKKKRRRPFLFPVGALSQVFRGQYIAALSRARTRGELRCAGESAPLADPVPWQALLDSLSRTEWVVYAKPPFGGPETVLKYLSRYTHRVAISNRRIRFVGAAVVRFRYRDYADHSRTKEMTLPALEFLRRFLLHVLPRGFMRIRHYAITANCRRHAKLARCRELLGQAHPAPSAAPDTAGREPPHDSALAGDSGAPRCPACSAPMRVIEIIPPTTAPYDTS